MRNNDHNKANNDCRNNIDQISYHSYFTFDEANVGLINRTCKKSAPGFSKKLYLDTFYPFLITIIQAHPKSNSCKELGDITGIFPIECTCSCANPFQVFP